MEEKVEPKMTGALFGGSDEDDYVNFVWMISGFSCQSSMLTHI